MQRVAMLSVHTSPLAQPGAGDGGGMNVYVRALGAALARAGVPVDVLTRAEHPEQPPCLEILPPGVDHDVFSPAGRVAARRHLGFGSDPVVLFVGRIQPLKGADLAVRALAEVTNRRTRLVVVGGPSGPDGASEVAVLHSLVEELGLEHRVQFVAPRPHDQLADFYRAADVCVVPSRTESFGLVALEAAACGTPVVAANVGGLRLLVDDGVTGYLVDERDPAVYASLIDRVLRDDSEQMRAQAVARSMRYRWNIAAARLRRH